MHMHTHAENAVFGSYIYMYLVWMTFTTVILMTQSSFSATVYTCVHVHTHVHVYIIIYNKCMCTCCHTLVYQMALSFCSHSHQSYYRYLHCKICILYLQNRVSEMLVTSIIIILLEECLAFLASGSDSTCCVGCVVRTCTNALTKRSLQHVELIVLLSLYIRTPTCCGVLCWLVALAVGTKTKLTKT